MTTIPTLPIEVIKQLCGSLSGQRERTASQRRAGSSPLCVKRNSCGKRNKISPAQCMILLPWFSYHDSPSMILLPCREGSGTPVLHWRNLIGIYAILFQQAALLLCPLNNPCSCLITAIRRVRIAIVERSGDMGILLPYSEENSCAGLEK